MDTSIENPPMPRTGKDVKKHLQDIRTLLHDGSLALYVGAGFSQNATLAKGLKEPPASWEGLAEAAAREMHPSEADDWIKRYCSDRTIIDVLSNYEGNPKFGRNSLISLIKKYVPDKKLLPNPLYQSMLSLPWTDIYTTNYDTLLERAAKKYCKGKYSIIEEEHDFPLMKRPRIIKLHGSLSCTERMIVTRDDYSRISCESSPFEKDIQGTLISHALCMIGCSGRDPDLINWRYKTKRVLDDRIPVNYLITRDVVEDDFFSMYKSGIFLLDLSLLENLREATYSETFTHFFNFLSNGESEEYTIRFCSKYFSPQQVESSNIGPVIDAWKSERLRVKKQLVLPRREREMLVMMTERWSGIVSFILDNDIKAPWDIAGIYEYNWRMEHCLMPIWNNMIPEYETILKRYNPYGISEFCVSSAQKICPGIRLKDLKTMWQSLCFAILRWSREEHDFGRFGTYDRILAKITKGQLDSQNRLCYEEALFALSVPDFNKFSSVMATWAALDKTAEWHLKYAAILAETGNFLRAENEIQNAKSLLVNTQQKPNSTFLSSLILFNQSLIEQDNLNSLSRKNTKAENCRAEEKFRLRHSNPQDELEYFKNLLDCTEVAQQSRTERRRFDYTSESTTFFSGWPKQQTAGFQLIRYIEETGLLLHFGHFSRINGTLSSAVKRIAPYSPHLAFSYLHRSGITNVATVEDFFSQHIMHQKTKDESNLLLDYFIPAAKYLMQEKVTSLPTDDYTYFNKCFQNLVEAISCLTVKADDVHLDSVLNFYLDFYDNALGRKSAASQNFQRYIRRTFEAMRPEAIYKNLPRILEIHPPDNEMHRRGWFSPAAFVSWRGFSVSPASCSPEQTSLINFWIEKLKERDPFVLTHALSVINCCIELGVLSSDQKDRVEDLYWQTASDGKLPARGNFYAWACPKFLFSSARRSQFRERLIDFIKSSDFYFYEKDGDHISWNQRINDAFQELANSILISFSVTGHGEVFAFPSPADLPAVVLKKIRTVWDNSKERLTSIVTSNALWDYDFSLVIKGNLLLFDRIIAEYLIPELFNDQESLTEIRTLLLEMQKLQPFPSSEILLSGNCPHIDQSLTKKIISAFSLRDIEVFRSYSTALQNAYVLSSSNENFNMPPSELLDCLIYSIGMKQDKTFMIACGTLGRLLRMGVVPEAQRGILCTLLGDLATETSFDCSCSRFPLVDRFDYRLHAAYLAAELYRTYSNCAHLPTELVRWQSICNNPDEFPQLRNQWRETLS